LGCSTRTRTTQRTGETRRPPIQTYAEADAVNSAELFDIDVDQFARFVALVTNDRRLRVQRTQPAQTEATQHRTHCGTWHVQLFCDRRSGHALAAQPLDRGDGFGAGTVRTSGGRRAPVLKGELAALPMPRQPTKSTSFRDAGSSRSVFDPPTIFADAADEQGSTLGREAGILMNVHPGLLGGAVGRCGNHSFTPSSRMNNLHSFDT
jgi:hypothetical protein